jgi:hypothetical protein
MSHFGGLGFVLRNFVRSLWLVACGEKVSAELKQALEGAVVEAAEAGFVAGEVLEESRAVGQGLHGEGEAGVVGEGHVILFKLRSYDAHFAVESGGLDGPGAAEAPGSGDHLVDQVEFYGVGRVELVQIRLAEEVEALLRFGFEDDLVTAEPVFRAF